MMIWIAMSAMTIAILGIVVSLNRLNKKLDRKVESLEDCLAKLSEVVAELKEPELDPIEKKIQEAKQEVFSEWIDNITNYTPYGQR